jgi:hypothetical protein
MGRNEESMIIVAIYRGKFGKLGVDVLLRGIGGKTKERSFLKK